MERTNNKISGCMITRRCKGTPLFCGQPTPTAFNAQRRRRCIQASWKGTPPSAILFITPPPNGGGVVSRLRKSPPAGPSHRRVIMQPLISFLFLFLFLISCGGGGGPTEISFSENAGDVGYIQLNVSGSESVIASEVAQIEQYKIVFSGDDFETKEQLLTSDAAGVTIQGIPIGTGRRVEIFALNSKEQVVRKGVLENIDISGGPNRFDITLQSIPVVLNVADGDFLSNRRLSFKVFSDPGHAVAVETEQPLSDILTSLNYAPTNEEGLARFYPGVLAPGAHTFTIQDLETGFTTTLSLTLWDGSQILGAPLFAASNTRTRVGSLGGYNEN